VSENKPNNNFAQNLYNDLNATIEKRACKGKEKPYVMDKEVHAYLEKVTFC
jgi:hypothetical protein